MINIHNHVILKTNIFGQLAFIYILFSRPVHASVMETLPLNKGMNKARYGAIGFIPRYLKKIKALLF